MSDRVSASITLGGTVTRNQWTTLLELIAGEDLRTEWDGPAFTAATPLESGALHLFAHEVPWGRFEALEQYACNERLPIAVGRAAVPAALGRRSSCSMGAVAR